MSTFAGHGRAMQVDDDAFDADGGGSDNKNVKITEMMAPLR